MATNAKEMKPKATEAKRNVKEQSSQYKIDTELLHKWLRKCAHDDFGVNWENIATNADGSFIVYFDFGKNIGTK